MDTNTRTIQLYCLELLKIFDGACRKNDLRYFMIGGTLLGAVRHKGFIPWDDDVDVAMPRKDYEYLISHSAEIFDEPFRILHYTNSDDKFAVKSIAAKFENSDVNIEMLCNDKAERKTLTIDIFPIDGTPDNAFLRKIFFFRIMAYRALFKFTFSDDLEVENENNRSSFEKLLIIFAKKTNIGKHLNRRRLLNKLENLLRKYDPDKAKKMSGTFLGAYKLREFVDAVYFRECSEYTFEDGKFFGPKLYDGYLKSIYGDYMALPPEEKRIGKHKILKVEKIK